MNDRCRGSEELVTVTVLSQINALCALTLFFFGIPTFQNEWRNIFATT